MIVPSEAGVANFKLVTGDPAPPARGINTWTVQVNGSNGGALGGLQMSALPFMPDHGHGSPLNATITDEGGGTYSVTPIDFFMPGVWRTTFTFPVDGGSTDSAAFFFCIPG
jgi:hypothetical protein